MRFLVILPSLLAACYGYNLFSNNIEDVVKSAIIYDCAQAGNGAKLPVLNDCNKFVLCDGNYNITLTCRLSEPHFNRCTSSCVDDLTICSVTSCDSDLTTTTTTTPSNVDSTTTSTITTTTTTPVTTTTKFSPPTVPSATTTGAVPPPAACTDNASCAGQCPSPSCDEQCECNTDLGTCSANTAITCPFDCVAECGCTENCDCTSGTCTACMDPVVTCPGL
ncbi:hypothetical protein ACKWTF_015733 [Chironomus riparius]